MKSKLVKYILPAVGIIALLFIVWKVFLNKDARDEYTKLLAKTTLNSQLKITYPLNNSIFPKEIASSTFRWDDPDNDTEQWLAMLEVDGKIQFTSKFLKERSWKPDSTDWALIKKLSAGKKVSMKIIGVRKEVPGKIFNGGKIDFTISNDEVGAPIFFRDVPLPFGFAVENLRTISWRLADVSKYTQPKILLTNFPVCGNCHSFSQDGKTMGMDVDYANDKGSYFLSPVGKQTDITMDKIMTWNDYKRNDNEFTFGLLSQVSPDGKHVLSTVKDRSIFVKIDNLDYSQLFFPIKGIIAYYDLNTKSYSELPGADNKELCQSNPVWSPDGKTVLFSRAPVYHNPQAEKSNDVILPTEYATEFIEGKRGFKYDIYQIPFNNGKGGEAKPLLGASQNGMSNFFPKYSPDGKWIVFAQAKNFMLLQPDTKLYIMPASGGTPRLMNCNNLGTMNSWHSWSPNGKWLVFSSKATGPYTQLYLTHIDENGNDSPAILLENMTIRNRAANIPEFVNLKGDELNSLVEKFIDNDNYTFVRGREALKLKDFDGSLKELTKAINLNPKDDISYNLRGIVYTEMGNLELALQDFAKVIELKPNSFFAYHNRANAKIQMKDFAGALEDLDKAIKMNPQSSKEYYSRGEAKFGMNDFAGAIKDFNVTLQMNPKNDQAYAFRATSEYNIQDYRSALKDFDKSIELNQKDSICYFKRAIAKLQLNMKESAYLDLRKASDMGYKGADVYLEKFYNGK